MFSYNFYNFCRSIYAIFPKFCLQLDFNFGFWYVKCFTGFIVTCNTVASIRRILVVAKKNLRTWLEIFGLETIIL